MLVVADTVVAPFTIVFFATFLCIVVARAVLKAVRGGSRIIRRSLVVRDGHVALSDEARARLGQRGLDVAKIESMVAKSYSVDERGGIVTRGTSGKAAPLPPTSNVPSSPSSTVAESDRPLFRKPTVEDLLRGGSGK